MNKIIIALLLSITAAIAGWFASDTSTNLGGSYMRRATIDSAHARTVNVSGRIIGTADSAIRADSSRLCYQADTAKKAGLTKLADSAITSRRSDTLVKNTLDTLYIKKLKSEVITVDSVSIGTGSGRAILDTVTGLELVGSTTVWNDVDDVNLSIVKATGTAGAPDWSSTGLGFNLNQYAIDDSTQGDNEIYHNFKIADSIERHLHYFTGGTDGATRYLKFRYRMWLFNNNDSTTYYFSNDVEDTIPANTKKMTQRIITFGKDAIPLQGIGARCVVIIRRITASSTAPTLDPFIAAAGMHMRVDMLGSRNIYTK